MVQELWLKIKKLSIYFSQPHKRSRVERYSIPVILVLLDLILKYFLVKVIPDETTYHILTIIVIISAWFGGLGPGLLATLLAGTLDTLFFFPKAAPNIRLYTLISTSIFVLGGIIISIFSEAKHQADLEKDEFIGVLSHELKNPLTSIKTYTQLLLKNATKENFVTKMKYLKRIEEQTDMIIHIINDLLDVTRIEVDKFSYTKEEFLVYPFLQTVIREQNLVSQTHKVKLIGKSKKKIYADKQRLQQVLVNLFTNAIKYSPDDNKVIVKLKNTQRGVQIMVKDFGIGIPEKQIKKIFIPFYRTSTAEMSNIKGLGLGLSIAKQIIKNHKGQLWVSSKPGKGTEFFIFLPCK